MQIFSGLSFNQIVLTAGHTVEFVGVVIIIGGFLIASVVALANYFRDNRSGLFKRYRRDLGESMLLGLEFLVAGDIIRTVIVEHTIESVLSLGLIVLIRTVLVFTINLEVEGRWPWQKGP